MFEETYPELDKNYIDVNGLIPEEVYEFIMVTVDGDTMQASDIVEIQASKPGIIVV